jgi:ubiquinone/menaquinone biosynthesis C-methylase UbiE
MPREDDLNTYTGLHAGHYDLIYENKPYRDEARLVISLARAEGIEGMTLLDLACGTGRHAREFVDEGLDVTGVDYSPDLLVAARRNVPEARFIEADMRRFDLGIARFDVITCLFDAIGYLQTNEGVVEALKSARRHLKAQGVLVLEFLHAPAVLADAETARIRRWRLPAGGELLRISETDVDPTTDLMRVSYELIEFAVDGSVVERTTETQTNRFFSIEMVRALMATAGFSTLRVEPALGSGPVIDRSSWHVLVVGR